MFFKEDLRLLFSQKKKREGRAPSAGIEHPVKGIASYHEKHPSPSITKRPSSFFLSCQLAVCVRALFSSSLSFSPLQTKTSLFLAGLPPPPYQMLAASLSLSLDSTGGEDPRCTGNIPCIHPTTAAAAASILSGKKKEESGEGKEA